METEKISKVLKKVLLVFFGIIILAMAIFGGVFFTSTLPVDSESKEVISFTVEPGWGKNKVAEELESKKLIKNAFFLKLYIKLNATEDFLAGTYELSPSMSSSEIMEYLIKGKSIENATISVTFVEGKRFPYYVSKISSSFKIDEQEIYDLLKDDAYLNSLITDYWFITDNILNEKLYYPLEGYLFPDTYEFKKDSTIKEIFSKMLNQMAEKLSVYKEEIAVNKYSVHDLLTMASMVELEAIKADDRLKLAGVFYNRLNDNWTLGSDVTTYYAANKEMTKRLTISELNDCNAYNTRGTCVPGLPVGPICSPSYSSITAAIEPANVEDYYFVADSKNNLHFGVTESDHLENINKLKKQNLWPE